MKISEFRKQGLKSSNLAVGFYHSLFCLWDVCLYVCVFACLLCKASLLIFSYDAQSTLSTIPRSVSYYSLHSHVQTNTHRHKHRHTQAQTQRTELAHYWFSSNDGKLNLIWVIHNDKHDTRAGSCGARVRNVWHTHKMCDTQDVWHARAFIEVAEKTISGFFPAETFYCFKMTHMLRNMKISNRIFLQLYPPPPPSLPW